VTFIALYACTVNSVTDIYFLLNWLTYLKDILHIPMEFKN